MLLGCTTTWIRSRSTSKSHLASITSRPLLTMVELSMVIFLPMDQLGCFKASSTCTRSICFLVQPRKGPPEAVRRILSILFPCSPFKHWKMALCSLSTGRRRTWCSLARGTMRWPAVTSVSLLARAMSFPDLMAAMVGRIPIIPTTAVTRISYPSMAAISMRPSMPETIFVSVSPTRRARSFAFSSSQTPQTAGLNSRICSSRSLILLPAAMAFTEISPLARTTSRVWVPMEPVEPRIPMVFISISLFLLS